MPDSHVLERWQEDIDFRREESVYLAFTLKLGCELGGSHLLCLVEDLSMTSSRGYLSVVFHVLECRGIEGRESLI